MYKRPCSRCTKHETLKETERESRKKKERWKESKREKEREMGQWTINPFFPRIIGLLI